MSDPSFTRFMHAEMQRITSRCAQIDAQCKALDEEKKILVTIAEALDGMQQLYERTGQSIDASLGMSPSLADQFGAGPGTDVFGSASGTGLLRSTARGR